MSEVQSNTPEPSAQTTPSGLRRWHRPLLIAALILVVLLAPYWGASKTHTATAQGKQASPLAVSMAYWSVVLPGYGQFVNQAQTQLDVLWQQIRDGAELSDATDVQQRAQHFLRHMYSWLHLSAVGSDGQVHGVTAQAHSQALALLVRLPWQTVQQNSQVQHAESQPVTAAAGAPLAPVASATAAQDTVISTADAAVTPAHWGSLAQAVQQRVLALLQSDAGGQLSATERFAAEQNLALFAAHTHDWQAAQQHSAAALQALPIPADITAHSADNTMRHLLPLRLYLSSCVGGHQPPADWLMAAQTALRHGYDVRQLRQQYVAGFDRALLLWAPTNTHDTGCKQVSDAYMALLTAEQPDPTQIRTIPASQMQQAQ